MDKQKIQKTLDFLNEYNAWRRGTIKQCPNSSSVGESIDFLIELVSTEILNKQK